VIVIQAGAALDVFDPSPQPARQALGSIGAAGRQALAELRRVLAAVRPQPGEQDGWAPPPGLSGPGGLLDRVRAAGLTVAARIDGAPAGPARGRGLIGIRERAALHGGTCAAGPRPGGGFVRVSFPLPGDGPS
jgi:signal transduction histidine kinase